MTVEVAGQKDGENRKIRYEMLDRYDTEHHITAMMRSTGYSLAVTGVMQADGRIKPGAHTPDECVPADDYVAELGKRGGIALKRREVVRTVAVNRTQGILEYRAQFMRRIATNDRSHDGIRPLFNPDGEVTDLKGVEGFALRYGKGVMHKILNRGQHAGHHIRLNGSYVSGDDMLQE